MPVSIRRSVLFDKPVELEITQDPLVDLSDFPALSRLLDAPANETPTRVATFDLRLPYVLSIGWARDARADGMGNDPAATQGTVRLAAIWWRNGDLGRARHMVVGGLSWLVTCHSSH